MAATFTQGLGYHWPLTKVGNQVITPVAKSLLPSQGQTKSLPHPQAEMSKNSTINQYESHEYARIEKFTK